MALRSETGRVRGGAAGKGLPAADRSLVDPGQTMELGGLGSWPGQASWSRARVCAPRPKPKVASRAQLPLKHSSQVYTVPSRGQGFLQ